jgi:hypothetical protein
MRGTSRVRPVAASATGPGRQEQALARWRQGWRKARGCCASSPSRCPGWQRRLSPGPGAAAARLLLAEAFITASGKPEPLPAGQHAADAVAAGLALMEILHSSAPVTSPVCCSPQDPLNLLAAMALWAGLRLDPAELHAEVLVVAAQPERKPQASRS